jgi:hypothetical protein
MRASLGAIALISTILILPISVLSQACEATSQNPYCDPSFANLICCPAPNVCYWADRQGTPACCASGQVCGVGGGVYITPQPTIVYATDSTQPTSTTTLAGGVVETVTSGAVAIYSTVVRFMKPLRLVKWTFLMCISTDIRYQRCVPNRHLRHWRSLRNCVRRSGRLRRSQD